METLNEVPCGAVEHALGHHIDLRDVHANVDKLTVGGVLRRRRNLLAAHDGEDRHAAVVSVGH